MGQLINTGASIAGHTTTFRYEGLRDDQTCVMTCTCGWSAWIESFRHPHSIMESQRRFDRHLVALGIHPSTARDEHQTRHQRGEKHQ